MIKVNLLPDDYRKAQRTPLRLMAAIVGGVAVNGTLFAWWAWTSLGTAAEVESRLGVLKTDLETLKPRVAYHQSLDRESTQFHAREETLARITQERVSWTEKVDKLVDVVNRGGDGDKYLIWLEDLVVSQQGNARAGNAGSVRAKGRSGSDNFGLVASFIEDMQTSEFSPGFTAWAPPEGRREVDEDLMPSVTFTFQLGADLVAVEPAPQPAPQPAAPAAPAAPQKSEAK
ncbi:MAG TPA: hypothetical protein VJP77_06995 [Planctomycetota bacterium]|nr:hypothetical protein [Planctomycetota bacterium]